MVAWALTVSVVAVSVLLLPPRLRHLDYSHRVNAREDTLSTVCGEGIPGKRESLSITQPGVLDHENREINPRSMKRVKRCPVKLALRSVLALAVKTLCACATRGCNGGVALRCY